MSRRLPVVLVVLTLLAWFGAFSMLGADGTDHSQDYATATVLAIIGGALLIVAAIYDRR